MPPQAPRSPEQPPPHDPAPGAGVPPTWEDHPTGWIVPHPTTGPIVSGPRSPLRRRIPRPKRPKWRGDTPTDPMPMIDALRRTPYRDPRVTRAAAEEREAREAMDLALRVGELMLRCGAGAPQVEASVVAVGMSAGLDNLDIDITMQSLLMQCTTRSGQLITLLRVVRSPRRDFARLTAVHSLVNDLISNEIDVAEAARKLRIIGRMPRTWSAWMVTMSFGLLSAAVALTLGAGFVAVVFSVIASVTVDRLVAALERRGVPEFYWSAIGGFVAVLIAWAAYAAGTYDWFPVSPSDFAYLVAGGIVVLLPSRTIASAMEDIITGYSVTGTSRIFEVLFHTLGLIVGVGAGLSFTFRIGNAVDLGVGQPPIENMVWGSAALPVVLLGSLLIGIAGAITLQSRRAQLAPVALLCALGVLLSILLGQGFGLGRVSSVAVTAIVLGFVGRLLALRLDAPAMVFIVPATFGLLPGLSIFVGLYRLVVRAGSDLATDLTVQIGLTTLLSAFGILIAIATGSVFGEILATPFDSTVGERRRMVRGTHRRRGRSAGPR